MDFQEFLRKTREYDSKKIKFTSIEIKDFGKIEFKRPTETQFLEYLEEMAEGGDTEGKGETFKKAVMASKKFIYNCCPVLQSKEVRNEYSSLEPYDIIVEIFGMTKTIELGSKIVEKFKLAEESEKIGEDIKNSSEIEEKKE